jgi:hypothetical protein
VGELESSVFLEDKQMILLQCAAEENCLSSSGMNMDRSNHGKLDLVLKVIVKIM